MNYCTYLICVLEGFMLNCAEFRDITQIMYTAHTAIECLACWTKRGKLYNGIEPAEFI